MKKQFVFYLFFFLLLSCLWFGLSSLVDASFLEGGDFRLVCTANKIFWGGGNPYDVYNIGIGGMPFRYPPTGFVLLSLVCLFSRFVFLVFFCVGVFLLFLLFCKNRFCVWPKINEWLFFLVLFVCGFNALFYNFANGQIAVIECFVLCLAFYFMSRKWWWCMCFCLGFLPLVKWVPLAYWVIIFFIPGLVLAKRFELFFRTVFIFWFTHLFCYLWFSGSDLYAWYSDFAFGGFPLLDQKDIVCPSLYRIVECLGGGIVEYVFAVILVVWFFFCFKRYFKGFDRVYWCVLCVMLTLPELKYYSFILAVWPIYWLCRGFGVFDRFIVLVLVVVLPVFCKMMVVSYGFSGVFWVFHQYWCLLGVVVFFVWKYKGFLKNRKVFI